MRSSTSRSGSTGHDTSLLSQHHRRRGRAPGSWIPGPARSSGRARSRGAGELRRIGQHSGRPDRRYPRRRRSARRRTAPTALAETGQRAARDRGPRAAATVRTLPGTAEVGAARARPRRPLAARPARHRPLDRPPAGALPPPRRGAGRRSGTRRARWRPARASWPSPPPGSGCSASPRVTPARVTLAEGPSLLRPGRSRAISPARGEAVAFVLTLGPALEAEVIALGERQDLLEAYLLDLAGWAGIEAAVRALRRELIAALPAGPRVAPARPRPPRLAAHRAARPRVALRRATTRPCGSPSTASSSPSSRSAASSRHSASGVRP